MISTSESWPLCGGSAQPFPNLFFLVWQSVNDLAVLPLSDSFPPPLFLLRVTAFGDCTRTAAVDGNALDGLEQTKKLVIFD